MDLGLGGKRVLITGGSKGIGLSCAEAFAAEGCEIILSARNPETLAAAAGIVRQRHPARIEVFPADLSRMEERQRLFAAHGNVDILVNNAGAIPGGTLLDISMERWLEAWSLKVMGYIHMTQLYLGAMKGRFEKTGERGVIMNIVGMAARTPRWDYICGATGNAALNAFTCAVGGKANELGVRVLGINPGATRTDRIIQLSKSRAKTNFGDESRWEEMLSTLPLGRPAEPEEVAALTVTLCSDKVAYVSGTMIDVDAGLMYRG
jgi:3-oxoacyl-[acyl-carrier protein] reductase